MVDSGVEDKEEEQRDLDDEDDDSLTGDLWKVNVVFVLILIGFMTVQFGHGSNIGVAVSLPGDSKASNLSLGSWVMVGVTLSLPITPWATNTFGGYRLCAVCILIDIVVILLMLIPSLGLYEIYVVRFLVGFFEAPILPYLQGWLACFGKAHWNVWNTVLHAMVPLGENCGYLGTQMLIDAGINWQWAFGGQAMVLIFVLFLCHAFGRRYLDTSLPRRFHYPGISTPKASNVPEAKENGGGGTEADGSGPEYPPVPKWILYWLTNVAFACQLGFLTGSKFVMRDYAMALGFQLDSSLVIFSAIALVGPALGGTLAMSGGIVRPDQWSEHSKTLLFLTAASGLASVFAWCLLFVPEFLFWPVLFTCFVSAGCIYPAAQGIVNTALTRDRVIEASVYQIQCNNLLFSVPMPYLIGKCMDAFGTDIAFKCVMGLQTLTCVGFFCAWTFSDSNISAQRWHSNGNRDEERFMLDSPKAGPEAELARPSSANSLVGLLQDHE